MVTRTVTSGASSIDREWLMQTLDALHFCLNAQLVVFVVSMIANLVSAIRRRSWEGVSPMMTRVNLLVAVAYIYYGFSSGYHPLATVGLIGVVCGFVLSQVFFVFPPAGVVKDISSEFNPARVPIIPFALLGVDFAFSSVTILLSIRSTGHTIWYSVIALGLASTFLAHRVEKPLGYLLFLIINVARIFFTGLAALVLFDQVINRVHHVSTLSDLFGPSIHILIGGSYDGERPQPELSDATFTWLFVAVIAGLLFFCFEECLVSSMLGIGLKHGVNAKKHRVHPTSNGVDAQRAKGEEETYGFHHQRLHSSCDSISVIIPAEKRK